MSDLLNISYLFRMTCKYYGNYFTSFNSLKLIALFSIFMGLFSEYPIKPKDIPDSDGSFAVISNIILSLSIFIGVLSFIGCYGVATDSKLYLLVYSTTLLILIFVQLFFGYGIYSMLKSIEGDAGVKFLQVIRNQTLHTDHSSHFMHEFQRKHNCCGFKSYNDWLKILSHIPGSCCGRAFDDECQEIEVSSKPSCEKILKERMEELEKPLMHFIMAVFIVEAILGVITACLVMRREP